MTKAPTFQFDIEEEPFLADARTRNTPKRVKPFHNAVHKQLPDE